MSVENALDRIHAKAGSSPWLTLFTAVTRILLAVAFLPSGWTKVLGEPFTTLPPTTSVGLFFAGFFQAQGYYRFVGIAQLAASALLLFRGTATIGAALYLPIILNIFVITISVGFTGTWIITGMMLLANLYLICWDYDRWKHVFPGFSEHHASVMNKHVSTPVFGLLFLSATIGISSVFSANVARLRGQGLPIALITLGIGALTGLLAVWRHHRHIQIQNQ